MKPINPPAIVREHRSLEQIKTEIDGEMKLLRHSKLKLGRLLLEAKESGEIPHGRWIPWLEERGIKQRSAYNYIELAKSAKFADFPDDANPTYAEAEDTEEPPVDETKSEPFPEDPFDVDPLDGPAAVLESDPFDVDPFGEESARDPEPETGGENRSQTEVAPPADSEPNPEQEFRTQRSKTVKTAEALMRAFDDLHRLRKNKAHTGVIDACRNLLQTAKTWE